MNKQLPAEKLDFMPLIVDASHRAVMCNAMVMGRWHLSQYALYILRMMMSKVKKGDTKFECYYVTTTKLAKDLGVDKGFISRNIEKWIDEIYNESLYLINSERGYVKCHWASIAAYDRHTHKGMLRLSDELAPFLLGLERNFGGYDIGTMMELKNVYAIRIYDLLNAKCYTGFEFTHKTTIYISVAEIRFACALDPIGDESGNGKYKNPGSLKQRVIDPAIQRIEEVKMLRIKCIPKKDGKNYIGYSFYIVPLFLLDVGRHT